MKPVDCTKDGQPRTDVSKDYFVGEPTLEDLTGVLDIKESKIYHVSFPKGAKTKLHYHQGGQLLIVTKGSGSLVIFKKIDGDETNFTIKEEQVIELKENSIQYIPPKVLHTHGSNGQSSISHIAINYNPPQETNDADTIWYESDFKHQVEKRL